MQSFGTRTMRLVKQHSDYLYSLQCFMKNRHFPHRSILLAQFGPPLDMPTSLNKRNGVGMTTEMFFGK